MSGKGYVIAYSHILSHSIFLMLLSLGNNIEIEKREIWCQNRNIDKTKNKNPVHNNNVYVQTVYSFLNITFTIENIHYIYEK